MKVTGWDIIERVKVLFSGKDKVAPEPGMKKAKVEWMQGDYLEPELGGPKPWLHMCFVGGLAFVENLLMRPGTSRLDDTETGNMQTPAAQEAIEACATVIREQFPERVRGLREWKAETTVITFNDHDDTTLEDVYTVLDKAAVSLAEKV